MVFRLPFLALKIPVILLSDLVLVGVSEVKKGEIYVGYGHSHHIDLSKMGDSSNSCYKFFLFVNFSSREF